MRIGNVTRRAAILGGLSAVLVPSVAWPRGDERDAEGGIGGTGIVGVVTDTGPLLVSGTALVVNGRTAFTDGFGAFSGGNLRQGHSLTVEAQPSGGRLAARRVHVTYPLVGKISAISSDGRRIRVNGVDVLLERRLRGLRRGDRVAVSGIWRGTTVVASRVDPSRSPLDLVSGDVTRQRASAVVGGVTLRGASTARLLRRTFAEVVGTYDAETNRFQARSTQADRIKGAAGPLARLVVEGYLQTDNRAPGYRISGLGHSFARNLDLSRLAQNRALFAGEYTGRFAVETAVALPEAQQARYRLLRSLR